MFLLIAVHFLLW